MVIDFEPEGSVHCILPSIYRGGCNCYLRSSPQEMMAMPQNQKFFRDIVRCHVFLFYLINGFWPAWSWKLGLISVSPLSNSCQPTLKECTIMMLTIDINATDSGILSLNFQGPAIFSCWIFLEKVVNFFSIL